MNDDDAEDALAAYDEYMCALRAGPYPVAPVRAGPVVVLLSLILAFPIILFGNRRGNGEESTNDSKK